MKNGIKAIIFDFVGVLMSQREGYEHDLMTDEIDEAIGNVVDDVKFKNEIMKKYKLSGTEFSDVLHKISGKYQQFKPLWEKLPELREKYKLAVINNGTGLTLPIFNAKFKINDNFDLFISSAICGLRKPDKRIYLLAAEKLGVMPGDCLFMDDLEENIKGAKAVGMKVVLWKDREKGFEEFCKFIF